MRTRKTSKRRAYCRKNRTRRSGSRAKSSNQSTLKRIQKHRRQLLSGTRRPFNTRRRTNSKSHCRNLNPKNNNNKNKNKRTRRLRKKQRCGSVTLFSKYHVTDDVKDFFDRCVYNVSEEVIQERISDFDSEVLSYFMTDDSGSLKNELVKEVLELANNHHADSNKYRSNKDNTIHLVSVITVIKDDELLHAAIPCE